MTSAHFMICAIIWLATANPLNGLSHIIAGLVYGGIALVFQRKEKS